MKLTQNGHFIYKASQPLVEPAKEFNEACSGVTKEHSIVLGCYTGQRLYIFDVNDPRLQGVKEVTAAHELLHAVYERLSTSERRRIDELTSAEAAKINSPRFTETVQAYRKANPSQVPNELHSIIGTEYRNLSPDLEKHYLKYFADRGSIVGAAEKYAATFQEIEEKQLNLKTKIEALKSQITTLETSLQSQAATLDSERRQMSGYESSGNTTAYNAMVGRYNTHVRTYNADLAMLQSTLASHNSLADEYNSLTSTQNNLVHQLDSQYQPIQ